MAKNFKDTVRIAIKFSTKQAWFKSGILRKKMRKFLFLVTSTWSRQKKI
jgi:hypothetical protein